ncbi:S8 family peptidase [Streptomyces cyaneofuscatus]
MRLLARVTTAALLALTPVLAGTPSAAAPTEDPAPLIASTDAVPGHYIVTLDAGTDPATLAGQLKVEPTFTYSKALNGFALPLTPAQLTLVRNTPGVTAVEEDSKVSAARDATGTRAAPSSTWGLDRIDQRALPLDDDFTTHNTGSGVTAYILDTGIDYTHEEFGGRAVLGFDAMPDADTQQGLDCNGHGTHVAGTVGGTTYGVASAVNLVSVRVLGCDGRGSYSGMIAGLDWVAKNAQQPAVLNGSLGGPKSEALNSAADALTDAGVLPVIAAGNDAADACGVSPASASRVLTVAASNRYDEETAFSNYGSCVTLYAPGEDITSAKLGGGSVALNGTSMAAPHVAGVVALHKQAHPDDLPEAIAEFIDAESTKDVLTKVSKSSPNQLLYTAGL